MKWTSVCINQNTISKHQSNFLKSIFSSCYDCLKKINLRFTSLSVAKCWLAAVSCCFISWCNWPALFLVIIFVNTNWSGFTALCVCFPSCPYPPSWKNKHLHQLMPRTRLVPFTASLTMCVWVGLFVFWVLWVFFRPGIFSSLYSMDS